MKRAIFIDRDGTLNEEVGYLSDLADIKFIDRAVDAIKMINTSDYLAVIITNQSGVARGYITEEFVTDVHNEMVTMLQNDDAHLDGMFYCPHHPEAGEAPYKKVCDCRKPKTGMLNSAKADFDIDLTDSFVIGDKYSDIELAHNVGARGVLVLTGYGRETKESIEKEGKRPPDHIADDLYDAIKWITSNTLL